MSENSLDNILTGDDEPVIEEVAEVTETVEEPVKPEPVRDDKGRFAPKGEDGASPAPQTEPELDHKAVLGERRRRQEAEARLREYEARLAAIEQQQAPPTPEFWEDPQSFMDQRFSKLGEELFQRWEQRQQAQRIDASEAEARSKYGDYDDALEAFTRAVQINPQLGYQMAQSHNPGEFAYNKGKAALALNEVGSIDEMRARIRAEVEAELKAQRPAPTIPETLADAPAAGAPASAPISAPPSLGDILKG